MSGMVFYTVAAAVPVGVPVQARMTRQRAGGQ